MTYAERNVRALQKNPYNAYSLPYFSVLEKQDCLYAYTHTSGLSCVSTRINFKKHTNFIVIGIGDGSLVKSIYDNMTEFSTMVIIEKYHNVIFECFGNMNLSKLLKDLRVCFIANSERDSIYKILDVFLRSENAVFNTPNYQFITMPYMKSQDERFVEDILYNISSQVSYYLSSFGNDVGDILEGLEHIVENWLNMKSGLGVNRFKEKYKNVPAIIVAGGPSLDKNIHLLKEAAGKALILTVDTTAKKVMSLGITPDSISTIERPDFIYDIFYKDMPLNQRTVFIGPPVVSHTIIDLFERKIITGRFGDLITKDMSDIHGFDSLELGMSCTHIPFAFAKHVGANPIIFIGQDLSFTKDNQTHFKEAGNHVIENKERILSGEKWVVGNDGSMLRTNEYYYNFLLWYENEIAKCKDITFINATEGGARIKGTQVMTLEKTIDMHCNADVLPLVQMYDEIHLTTHKSDNCDSEGIAAFDNMKLVANHVKNKLEDISGNIDYFTNDSMRLNKYMTGVLEVAGKCSMLKFMLQPHFLGYFRKIRQYPIDVSTNDQSKFILEFKHFHHTTVKLLDFLVTKFESYQKTIDDMVRRDA